MAEFSDLCTVLKHFWRFDHCCQGPHALVRGPNRARRSRPISRHPLIHPQLLLCCELLAQGRRPGRLWAHFAFGRLQSSRSGRPGGGVDFGNEQEEIRTKLVRRRAVVGEHMHTEPRRKKLEGDLGGVDRRSVSMTNTVQSANGSVEGRPAALDTVIYFCGYCRELTFLVQMNRNLNGRVRRNGNDDV